MVGATVGVPFINYEEQKIYEEEELEGADAVPFFNSLNFQEDISTSGVGINLKLGMIYRINQMFRLGAAVHTPTAFSLFAAQESGVGSSALVLFILPATTLMVLVFPKSSV